MPNLVHLPLERYPSRYTEYLDKWERRAFKKAGFSVDQIIPPEDEQVKINIMTGEVLDSVRRPLFCFQQMTELMRKMEGAMHTNIYCSDFFTPGIEAIPYTRRKFTISSYCWAQSWDIYDFTNKMVQWMRSWEYMALAVYDHIFVASEGLRELMIVVAPDAEHKIHTVGLPFNSRFVGKKWDKTFMNGEEFDCAYTSRWDREKNPVFFLEMAAKCPDLKFVIVHPNETLRGSAVTPQVLEAIDELKNVTVLLKATKPEYYAVLMNTRVQMNTAFQDWVSFTLLEALTYECLPLYPNFRSFPEALHYDERFLYRPTDLEDAERKLRALLESDTKPPTYILEEHDGSLTRIAEIIKQTAS